MNWEPGRINVNTMASLFGQRKLSLEQQIEICEKEINHYENSICKRTRKLCPYQTQECLNQANILLIEADTLHFFSNHLKLLTK